MRLAAPLVVLSLTAAALAAPTQAEAAPRPAVRSYGPAKSATQVGYGGAVTSVDPYATRIGLRVLKHGGNAADAAIATAAALGVTEPFSSGIGGGGYFLYYSAKRGTVQTIDGRETAPAGITHDAFIDPRTGKPYNFSPQLVTSGVSVGVPGTLATWKRALGRFGTRSLARTLRPAAHLARSGFVVDPTFHDQVVQNKRRFEAFVPTKRLYLRGGHAPRVGSTFRNPDLAATYARIAHQGTGFLYGGQLGRQVAHLVRRPPTTKATHLPVPPGSMRISDIARYRTVDRKPTQVDYRGLEVDGMAPSSSGGSTVGEALNILGQSNVPRMSRVQALHHYLEASALSFADRNAYVGDPASVDVPLKDLLSDKYAAERACLITPHHTLRKPVAAGDVTSYDGACSHGTSRPTNTNDTENTQTTNLTVADRWGNVAEYTLTIEETGGSGIVVPGRGFLLNNELTDFSPVYDSADPNRIEPGKRPRSSMSPTIVLQDGRPFLAVGSPGGSTIITTVLQILLNRVDLGMSLPQAIAAPRATQRNDGATLAEPAFVHRYAAALAKVGEKVKRYDDIFTGTHEIGAATGIEFRPHGRLVAAAEPTRRGGGSAMVVHPKSR